MPCVTFCNVLIVTLGSCYCFTQPLSWKNHPFLAVCSCLLTILRDIFCIWRLSPPLAVVGKHHAVVTGTHFADLNYGFWRFITKISANFQIALFFSIKLFNHILIYCLFVNFNASEDVTNYTVSCETISLLVLYWSEVRTLLKFDWNEPFVKIMVIRNELTCRWYWGLNCNYLPRMEGVVI